MTCRVLVLDFSHADLFKAATPESISKTSGMWETDLSRLGPWERVRSPRFGNDSLAWQPRQAGDGPFVFACGSGTSTMDIGWHLIETGRMAHWDSVICVQQSAGRGQQKRHWISPAGNIHASWYWPLPVLGDSGTPNWEGLLPLIAGFIFARVLKDLNIPVHIKWPNDLLINDPEGDRKFGGILVERREGHVLVGIGINITYAPEDSRLREEFAVPATHLSARGYDALPLSLWMTLVTRGRSLLENLTGNTTPADFIRIIERQLAWIGKTVQVRRMNSEVFEAVMLGLAADGGLRIKTGGKEEVMYSGSIIPL